MWPDPGGLFSILLLFPIIFFSSRMAEASPIENTRARRTRTGIVLGVCVLLMAIFPLLGPIAFLVVLFYGLFCGIQIMRRGNGGKRCLLGGFVAAFTFFAIADYWASFGWGGHHIASNEASAVGTLRRLSSAEEQFSDPTRSGSVKDVRYGTIEDLHKNQLIADDLGESKPFRGYVFRAIIDPERKHFFFYAFPLHLTPSESVPEWTHILPGCALYYNTWRRDETHGTGVRTFAVDETGNIRYTILPIAGPVTREEIARWERL
jgi:hypothetical protein